MWLNSPERSSSQGRNDQIGFIFQQFFSLPKLSAKERELPSRFMRKISRERKHRAQQFLEKLVSDS